MSPSAELKPGGCCRWINAGLHAARALCLLLERLPRTCRPSYAGLSDANTAGRSCNMAKCLITRAALTQRAAIGACRLATEQRQLRGAIATDARQAGWAAFSLLVGRQIRPYVPATSQRLPLMSDRAISSMPPRVRPAVWVGAGVLGALAAATALLWAHYGSAVFFETIMAGLSFCF
jgi:hypothetical protein